MLPDGLYWKLIEDFLLLVTLAILLLSEDLFGYIPGISTAAKELSRGKVQDQPSPEMPINWLSERDTNLTKEASFSTTLWFKL